MRWKPAILISLILLLLIGGGAVAFYLHLGKQAPPLSTEVDRFLRHSAAPGGRKLIGVENATGWRHSRLMELNPFGGSSHREIPARNYKFTDDDGQQAGSIFMSFEHQSIFVIVIQAEPADVELLKAHLLEKFPNLRTVIHWTHTPYHP